MHADVHAAFGLTIDIIQRTFANALAASQAATMKGTCRGFGSWPPSRDTLQTALASEKQMHMQIKTTSYDYGNMQALKQLLASSSERAKRCCLKATWLL
mmetsp:Transcript_33603/g.73740  ORF Transcript_33603/g.73740 Transcript_33603/m.73740 type:complete len:99 (+) Transcript_33603:868-1164(+)